MPRFLKADVVSAACVIAPAMATALAAARGASHTTVLSVACGSIILALLAHFALIARPRLRWLDQLDDLTRRLGADLRGVSPPQSSQHDAASAVVTRLRQAGEPLAQRVRALDVDLNNLRSIYDASISPSLATDARGCVLVANNAALQFFADVQGPLVGRFIDELFTQAQVLGQHASALAGKSSLGQVRMPRAEGLRVFQVLTTPVSLRRVEDGPGQPVPGVVLTLRDVTDLSLALQLKTDFVANASHELRTPLSSIRASVETLADGAWDEPPMRERLTHMIANNVARLEEMIGDMLDLSRLESPDAPIALEVLSLRELAESVRETLDSLARERRLAISIEVAGGADRLETDRKLLTLILRNLVDNAIKFAFEGTTIRVVADALPAPLAQGRTPRRPGIRLRVIDKGVGIPLGHQQRIFERFYQVDPSRTGFTPRRGTGLGLAIVKHAVKALGGSISVESVWKEGTTMTVELPASVAP